MDVCVCVIFSLVILPIDLSSIDVCIIVWWSFVRVVCKWTLENILDFDPVFFFLLFNDWRTQMEDWWTTESRFQWKVETLNEKHEIFTSLQKGQRLNVSPYEYELSSSVLKLTPICQISWEPVVCLAWQKNIFITLSLSLPSSPFSYVYSFLRLASRILTGRHQHW